MTFSRLESINVRHLTTNQPFYASVILIQDDALVVTLHRDGLPVALKHDAAFRLGGVGGRTQEAGETIWECAMREARQELCSDIHLLSSPLTYMHDIDNGDVYSTHCTDTPAPFLLERQSNLYPYTPSRSGLPTGPYTYFGHFLAQARQPIQDFGNGVAGLLCIPLGLWAQLHPSTTLGDVLAQGAQIVEHQSLPRQSQLWLHPDASFNMVITLLKKHPDVKRP